MAEQAAFGRKVCSRALSSYQKKQDKKRTFVLSSSTQMHSASGFSFSGFVCFLVLKAAMWMGTFMRAIMNLLHFLNLGTLDD